MSIQDEARAEALADFIATERDKYPRRADDMDSEELAQKIIEWLASRQPEAASDTGTHDRDRMGICRSCGRGITAVEVLDGEKRCVSSQPVQVEVTEHKITQRVPWPPSPESTYMLSLFECPCGWKTNTFKDTRDNRATIEGYRRIAEAHAAALGGGDHE